MLFAALLFTAAAHAQLNFGALQHSGSGCRPGTVATAVSPDGQSLSVLFDSFQLQVPQYDGNNDNDQINPRLPRRRGDHALHHRHCNLAISVDLPAGQAIEAIELSTYHRGATILDEGVTATFTTSFNGQRGLGLGAARSRILVRKLWGGARAAGPVNEDWISNPVMQIPVGSGCANARDRRVNFDLRSHITAEILNGDLTRSGLVTVDSADINGSLKLRVITRPCGANSAPQTGERPFPGRRSGPRWP